MEVLRVKHPHVWQELLDHLPEPVGEIEITDHNIVNLKLSVENNCYHLHNPLSPENDGLDLLERIPTNEFGFVALIGFGLGYAAQLLIKHRPNIQKFAFLDISPGIFIQAVRYVDLRHVFSDSRVVLGIGASLNFETTLRPAVNVLQFESIYTLLHAPSIKTNPQAYKNFIDELTNYVGRLNFSGTTSLAFGAQYVANRFANLTTMRHDSLLEQLSGKFTGLPAFVVSGGPSLDKNIQHLSQAKGKSIIIAADSALPALLEFGIEPEFVTLIDPQSLAFEKIADVSTKTKNISLICKTCATPLVPKTIPFRRIFWSFTSSSMEQWLNNLLGGTIALTELLSVSHLSFLSAKVMGCSPIIFVGQDLAFTDGRDHSSFSVLSGNDPAQSLQDAQSDFIWVDSIKGHKIATSIVLSKIRETFEYIISAGNGKFINASADGAHIAGTEVLQLDQTIKLYCNNTFDFELIFKHVNKIDLEKLICSFKSLESEIQLLQSALKEISNNIIIANKKIQFFCKKNQIRSFANLPIDLQKIILNISNENNKIANEVSIWENIAELTLHDLKISERMKPKIANLEGNTDYYYDWLMASLEHIQFVTDAKRKALAVFLTYLKNALTYLLSENALLNNIKSDNQSGDEIYELKNLYWKYENYTLAMPLIEQASLHDISANSYFQRGIIEAYQCKFKEMEHSFAESVRLDCNFVAKIDTFRNSFAEKYLNIVNNIKSLGNKTRRRLLFKGLRYCVAHNELNNQFSALAQADLNQLELLFSRRVLSIDNINLTEWIHLIDNNKYITNFLPEMIKSSFYKLFGKIQASNGNIHGSTKSYLAALQFTPTSPEIFLYLADNCFAQNRFEDGAIYLRKAISFDSKFGIYWENIGDNFFQQKNYSDAIYAYKEALGSNPTPTHILCKIGDCYKAVSLVLAADFAYKIYNDSIGKINCQRDIHE